MKTEFRERMALMGSARCFSPRYYSLAYYDVSLQDIQRGAICGHDLAAAAAQQSKGVGQGVDDHRGILPAAVGKSKFLVHLIIL